MSILIDEDEDEDGAARQRQRALAGRRDAPEKNTLLNAPPGVRTTSKGAALFALASLVFCGGGPRPASPSKDAPTSTAEVAAAPSPTPGPGAETTVEDYFSEGKLWPGYDGAKLLKAWRREPGRERYRLARADDFTIPEAAKRTRHWPDTETALARPFMFGEFDGNLGHNLVLLVADRTKQGPDRFGVVLFKERKAGGYDVHWVYRDADFSRGLTVHRHSGDIYLTKFGPDGSDTSCDIEWSRAERRFVCRDL